jgi:murein L,D-transpeptidase YcbB/YkuD
MGRVLGLAAFVLSMALAAGAVAQPAAFSADERSLIYRTLQGDEEATRTPLDALEDRTLSEMLQRYARKELGQRVAPTTLDRTWAIAPVSRDVAAEFAAARAVGRLSPWLSSLSPTDPKYPALKGLYGRYVEIVAGGGWTPLTPGPTLKAGARSAIAAQLRARLAAEGYGSNSSADADLFDADLKRSLERFQAHHGLGPDGVLGPATRAALNVTAEARLLQIETNLERLRWLPRDLPIERVEVDTGRAIATFYRKDAPPLAMRAIVGKPATKTPMFVSRLEAVVFNPPWNIPGEIAANEILPRAARDPTYLAREGIVRTPGGLQQRPGPKNALGVLKFDLSSPFGVYLHDTPARSAFARDVRALSHGCMRLEKPRELAAATLGWSLEQVNLAIEPGLTRRVPLPRSIALYVVHTTVFVGDDGQANFLPDVYGWDAKLARALAGVSPLRTAEAAHATECSVNSNP